MGIFDEAIREHLELKRQHGVGDSELKQLEDEAFGPPARPGEEEEALADPFAEAPTEFMTAPPEAAVEEPKAPEAAEEKPGARREPVAEIQEAPESAEEPREPSEEEHPAMEHEAVTEPPAEAAPADPSTEERERQEIASHPTEMYDVEGEVAAAEPVPSEEELVEEEMNGPRLAPVDSIGVEEDEDDFFDEQRLSDELDQALEAPAGESAPGDSEEFEAVGEVEEEESVEAEEYDEEDEAEEEEEPPAGRREGFHDQDDEEDVLKDTPDFLEDAPEDDQLWFEQKPPKDFDFDD